MKYSVTKWTVKKLHETYSGGLLDLSPPYQRNFIWTPGDQQNLIDSIIRKNPIPNFFLLETKPGSYEMVDGQQRSRTILSFLNEQFSDLSNKKYSKKNHPDFLNYDFPVTIITDTEGESITKFYALVNKTGVHVNKPEVRKADYYETNTLKLVEDLSVSKKFIGLKLFTDQTMKRMNDVDFISELVVLINQGHVDKKNHIDEYFKNDLTNDDVQEVKLKFNNVLDKMASLNSVFEISKTRYKQRNDFYTLFDFILKNQLLTIETLKYFYKTLVLISSDIKPTQEKCMPLQEYARNCVTQSNSKAAREKRLQFFNQLLLNKGKKITATQKTILTFYNLPVDSVIRVQDFLVIDVNPLNILKPLSFAL